MSLFLLSCDIPYVAEGSWGVVYELSGQQRFGVWHISEESGEGRRAGLQIDELELAGSRILVGTTNPLEPAGSVQRLNFNGTVEEPVRRHPVYQSVNLTITGTRQ